MNVNNPSVSVETFKLHSEFQRLRSLLLHEEFAERLDRPLAYWALPVDRRLPLAFLGRTLRDLLDTPFEQLSATPGVGHKKISTLIELLIRATKKMPHGLSVAGADKEPQNRASRPMGSFDPAIVSEALWEQWRETVRRHGVGHEKLGRLAPSLQALPTVIWNTPLSQYADYSVAQIRQMKTHGEKRIRTILQVFHAVHQSLANTSTNDHLTLRLAPRFAVEVDRAISNMIDGNQVPSRSELRDEVVIPLVEQVRLDAGAAVAKLVEGRLGVSGQPQPVRHQSRRMGVTRARVYQLLETCAMVMAVRWPEGGSRLRALQARLTELAAPADRIELIRTSSDLLFPVANTAAIASNGHAGH